MIDSNVASTIDWQKEYQSLFIKVDQNLTRAIEAEKHLKVAKELLAEQEIQIALWKQRYENNSRSIKEATNHMLEARRHLDVARGTW